MKTVVKAFILLILVLAIFGGAAWYAYDLYLKPHKSFKTRSAGTKTPAATPVPDRSSADYDTLIAAAKAKTRPEAIADLRKFLIDHPTSSRAADARKLLGSLNLEEFFSHAPSPSKTEYVVVPGDSLARIASKNKVSFDLIIRANNIDRLLIHPGDRFIIPNGEFSIELSPKNKTVTLKNNGEFFKEYQAISASFPPNLAADGIQVNEKIAWHDGKRVAFGDKNYVGSSRWITFSSNGLTLYSSVEDGTPIDVEPPGSGAKLSPEDLDEVFALVNRGTPVTIAP